MTSRKHSLQIRGARTRWAVAITVLATAFHVTYVTPARAAAETRALRCCAAQCHRPSSPTKAAGCCGLPSDGSDVATVSLAKPATAPGDATVLILAAILPDPQGQTSRYQDVSQAGGSRAAPIFLLTCTLRL